MKQKLQKVGMKMKSLFPAGYFHQRENTKWGCCQGQFYCGKEGCKISASLYPERVCKHCMVKVFDAMCPEKKATLLMWTWPETPSLNIYSSFHQSKRSACGKGKYFITYSLAVDEKNTTTSDIAQLSIFTRGFDSRLCVTEEFWRLCPMHGTTTRKDLYKEVCRCLNEIVALA